MILKPSHLKANCYHCWNYFRISGKFTLMGSNKMLDHFKKVIAIILLFSIQSVTYAQSAAALQGLISQQGIDPSTINLPSGTLPSGFNSQNPGNNSLPQNHVSPKPLLKNMPLKSEFQIYVERTTGQTLERFGADLAKDGDQTFSPPAMAAVPGDYLVGPGDEISIRTWGSFDADFRVTVDRAGQISIPKVGVIKISGVSYASLDKVLQKEISKTYSGVNVSSSMGRLRGIRVYVTGYVQNPGAYTVNNLSSLINIVMAAGGPSSAGSLRNIQLKRVGKTVTSIDLYDLLLKGDKSGDRPVISEDVIHVGPSGPQVAIVGSVNQSAIFELKKEETVEHLLSFAGGFVSGSHAEQINHLSLKSRAEGFKPLVISQVLQQRLTDGDIFMVTSEVGLQQPSHQQLRMVKVDGQVLKPGIYSLKPHETLQDAIQRAGGLASSAYLFGTHVERVSVKATQEKNLERFRREAKKTVANDALREQKDSQDIALINANKAKGAALIAAVEELQPEGRLALHISPKAKQLPPILVENGDVITVPAIPSSVSVIGSVLGGQVVLNYDPDESLDGYIQMAGGYSRGADTKTTFVIRQNGEFVNASSGWFGDVQLLPGDAIFVPENLQKTTFTRELKDWAQIIYQLGLGAAAIKVLRE